MKERAGVASQTCDKVCPGKRRVMFRLMALSLLALFFLSCVVGCGNIGGQFGHPDEPEARSGELKPFPADPPPKASSYYQVQDKFFRNTPTFGDAISAISAALDDSGYKEIKYYATKDGGVALVTRMEKFADDGSVLPEGDRWAADNNSKDFGGDLLKLLHNMYFVERGRFRIFVFFVGSSDLSSDKTRALSRDEAKSWFAEGNVGPLPRNVAERPFGKAHCTVALYEFESTGAAVNLIPASKIPVGSLIKQNGLLASLEPGR